MSANRFVLGTRKGVSVWERSGRDWQMVREAYRGVPFTHAMRDPRTGILWAAADHGHWGCKLYRSMDMGENWQEVSGPKYPAGETYPDSFPGDENPTSKPATVSYIWLIAPGHPSQPNRLYLGTEPGGLFQSDNGGDTFELVRGLWDHPTRLHGWFGGGRDRPGLCSLIIDPRDSQHLIAGISVGGVYESYDDGQSWQPRNKGLLACYLPDPHAEVGHDPHYITAAPSNPDVLWQQNHCGIFRSVDSGRNWSYISQEGGPAHFGFPIVADEQNEKIAWVVPALSDEIRIAVGGALCVCRTEDGGQSWQTLQQGLPTQNSYDVVFRHALDLHGNTLIFGTTTGNLYLSEDRGDHWHCLGNNLPPIYSVRFA